MSGLSYDEALAAIRRLAAVAAEHGDPLGSPIVLVGGTAMAAWSVRERSNDVDLYTPHVPAAIVEAVEEELRAIHGPAFRLDVTAGENLWGSILVRDIAASPSLGNLDPEHELRALSIEDLLLLKLASGRARDVADVELLAPRTNVDALVARWNQLVQWHGDRRAVLGFADATVTELVRRYGAAASDVIERLAVTPGQREALRESHGVAG